MEEWFSQASLMAPGEPVWVTEYGFHNTLAVPSRRPVDEITAARYTPRFAALAFSKSPRGRFYIYELVDSGTDPRDREHNLGMIRYDFSRKPVFHSIRRVMDTLKSASGSVVPRDVDIRFSGDTPAIERVLLQKADGNYLLMMWQEVPSWDTRTMRRIPVTPRSVTVTLPRAANFTVHDTIPFPSEPGRDAPPASIPGARTSATVDVPDHLIFVEFKFI
jgi:hypothetical protein